MAANEAIPDATDDEVERRDFLRAGARGLGLLGLGLLSGVLAARTRREGNVWQIDPQRCIQCDRCATECVLDVSAVRCVHTHSMCGHCELCTGYFEPAPAALDTGAENQLCPTGAVKRRFIEEPYYEYSIDETLCIGCAKCVVGCTMFGNGSLYLQVRHDRCLNCNECAIARACPADAFSQVPATEPYLLKSKGNA